jgi:hypothetical protein
MENNNPNHHSAENPITMAVSRVAQGTEYQIHRAEVYTRRSPIAALAIAAASGYVLRSLPVRALVGLFVRLGLVLVRPFIFVLGAVSLYQLVKTQADLPPNSHAGKEHRR